MRSEWQEWHESMVNCVLGQDTEMGILKRHILHVSQKQYELV